MAHTCPQCCAPRRLIAAPAIDDDNSYELVSGRLSKKKIHRLNSRYRHDFRSWKRMTRARRQYERHPQRLREDRRCLSFLIFWVIIILVNNICV